MFVRLKQKSFPRFKVQPGYLKLITLHYLQHRSHCVGECRVPKRWDCLVSKRYTFIILSTLVLCVVVNITEGPFCKHKIMLY